MSLRWFRSLWGDLWRQLFHRKRPLKTVRVEELPDALDANSVYIVGEGDYLWFVALLCPCGCGESLHMNLLPENRPRWELTENKEGNVTLHPSVWRKKGCHSHFFLRRGLIKWCDNEA
jgi:hypothetical protein